MDELNIRIKTLTPLWTGGIDTTMDRIHETGILGSIRWWYEAIVRGLGGIACDPTGDDRCPDRDGKYCDVCAVFGTTGLKRAFRLEGPEWWNEDKDRRLKVRVSARNHGWFLGRGFMGESQLNILPLRWPKVWTEKDLKHSLLFVFALVEKWTGIGARTQQGYGVIAFDGIDVDFQKALNTYEKLKHRENRRVLFSNNLPSIEDFFFAKVRFRAPEQDLDKWVKDKVAQINPDEELNWYLNRDADTQREIVFPISPIVRYHLRNLARGKMDKYARHNLLGKLGKKSLVHVSHAYPVEGNKWEFRIWGWIPDNLSNNLRRTEALKYLKKWIGISEENSRQWHDAQNGPLWQNLKINSSEICWFEKGEEETTETYLKSLLEGCKGGTNET